MEQSKSPVENFSKTSSASSSGSQTSSSKKKTSVNIPTPKSSQMKISSTGKLADDLLAMKSAAKPQHTSHSAKTPSSSRQKIAAGEESAVVHHSASSSHKISHSLATTPRSGRLGVSKATGSKTNLSDQKSTEATLGMKGKRPKQECSTKVNSTYQSKSEKQPVIAHGDSTPTSRLSMYVFYV